MRVLGQAGLSLKDITPVQTNTLSTQISQYQDQINELNAILAEKRTQLQNEFNDMETTLSSLQSQGTLLSALSSIKVSAPSSTGVSAIGSGSSSSSSG